MKILTTHGQALVTLLLFVIISVTITSGAIIVILLNSRDVTQISQYGTCRAIAETGVENALLRLLRNPGYTGEVMSLDGGSANVQVAMSSGTYTITSAATLGSYHDTIQVVAIETNDVMSISSWKEL